MHLLALTESADHVCCRYRLKAFRSRLESASHTLEVVALPKRWWARWQLLRSLRGANVIVQRLLLPGWQVSLLRRAANLLIFDVDDAVFLRDSYAPKGLHHKGRLRRFATVVSACDAVVAGNRFLHDEVLRCTSRPSVHIIPTCVEPGDYLQAKHCRTMPGVQLVWVGSVSTLQGLERARPLFEELGRRVPGIRLKIISDRSFELAHLPVEFCLWRKETEFAEIADGDIGINWVPNDLWSRGKATLKTAQYLAAGLPVVANPVGVHCEQIRHGHNGFLAETPEQWIEAVSRLAHDPDLRRRLGHEARRTAEEKYSVAYGAQRWLALLADLQQRQRQAA